MSTCSASHSGKSPMASGQGRGGEGPHSPTGMFRTRLMLLSTKPRLHAQSFLLSSMHSADPELQDSYTGEGQKSPHSEWVGSFWDFTILAVVHLNFRHHATDFTLGAPQSVCMTVQTSKSHSICLLGKSRAKQNCFLPS